MADYTKLLADLKDAVLVPVKAGAKEFLDANADARAFLEDRVKRLAELGVDYVKPDADHDAVKLQMEVVQQSIRNELSKVALGASMESRATFGKILDTAVGVLIKALPVIIAAL
jgi:hypothetical protein